MKTLTRPLAIIGVLALMIGFSAWQIQNPSSGSNAVTGGTCTNQVATAISSTGVPTCSTVSTAMIGTLASGSNGLAASATTDTTSATNITTGTLPAAQLPASAVQNNQANTATTAMTLDMSGSTVANAFRTPVGAGLTAGVDGAIVYDSTAKNTHIRLNGTDALAVGETVAIAANVLVKSANANIAATSASSISDNATTISSAENWSFGTAGGKAHVDLTMGSTTSDMTVQSSATCTNITGMTWNIAASKNYRLTCNITRTLAASATIGYCLGGPGTATSYNLVVRGNNGASSAFNQIETGAQTAYGTKTASSTANAATATDEIYAFIQNGSTASGTALTLQTFGNGTNNLTVKANSSCDLKQVN